MKYVAGLILILLIGLKFGFNSNIRAQSVLRDGEWYKLGVIEKNIYRLDKSYLSNLGINVNSIDPRNIKIFGNGGGGMLPQANDITRPDGLIENAIVVAGEEDGSFNDDDYLLFFGNTSDLVRFDEEQGIYAFENNLYSDTTFYFLCIGDEPGKRIEQDQNINGRFEVVTSNLQLIAYEKDELNLLKGGRNWYGEIFSQSSDLTRSFSFDIQDLIMSSEVLVHVDMLAASTQSSNFSFSLNDQNLGDLLIPAIIDPARRFYDTRAISGVDDFSISADQVSPSNSLNLNISYDAPLSNSIGYLDKFLITYETNLAYKQKATFFQNPQSIENEINTYQLQKNADDLLIWDITDHLNPENQLFDLDGNTLTFSDEGNEFKKYVAFKPQDALAPISAKLVQNQNLRGSSVPELIIVTPPKFITEANRLASHRRSFDNMQVDVVTINQVYNEFSSGMQDVTALKDYMRYLKNKSISLKYLLLFGDCSYDYKNRLISNTNYIPVYQARNSEHLLYNYSSDDYFGFLEDDEGEWIENFNGDHTVDIGIGRLPIKSLQEAKDVVDKIIRYETGTGILGKWRNKIHFVADDEDNNLHQGDAEELAEIIESNHPEYSLNKLYVDAFQQIPQIIGNKLVPALEEDLKHAINNGGLVVNFTGHGNEGQWTDEKIFTELTITQLENRKRLPLFVTATCEFGNYDNPLRVSGGERLLLNPNGGAIGLITTTRPVFSNSNFQINKAFVNNAFKKINGEYPRLGDIIRITKNESTSGRRNRSFALLGDPSMRLAYPDYDIKVDSIYAIDGIQVTDTLKSLSKATINGSIIGKDGSVNTAFDGEIEVTVYDKSETIKTLGDGLENIPFSYSVRNSIIFNGRASISDGVFEATFIVPKNISHRLGKGKISLYAIDRNEESDASGAYDDFIIGGSATAADDDNRSPELKLFINDESFASGDDIPKNSVLHAEIFDESGINVSSNGLGQNIELSINDEVFFINDQYIADLDTYQSGAVIFPLNNLKPGNYVLTLKVWDTHNNSAEKSVTFSVTNEVKLLMSSLEVYPNPTSNTVKFSFLHDREGQPLQVGYTIYDVDGKSIKQAHITYDDAPGIINDLMWDGTNHSGLQVKGGIYLYKLQVQSILDGAKNESFGRVVKIN